mmetsp:Transcript_21511/g.54180  ORF Transcript_21511/g.54180 Transcript_21511/m.54180 type:complete len:236 (+) Transcript_21511:3123-3830(+)
MCFTVVITAPRSLGGLREYFSRPSIAFSRSRIDGAAAVVVVVVAGLCLLLRAFGVLAPVPVSGRGCSTSYSRRVLPLTTLADPFIEAGILAAPDEDKDFDEPVSLLDELLLAPRLTSGGTPPRFTSSEATAKFVHVGSCSSSSSASRPKIPLPSPPPAAVSTAALSAAAPTSAPPRTSCGGGTFENRSRTTTRSPSGPREFFFDCPSTTHLPFFITEWGTASCQTIELALHVLHA